VSLAAAEREVIQRACPILEAMTVTEWADRYRMLPETSTAPGPFQSSVIPYARKWMDVSADPDVRFFVLCWASQTCKSTVLENGLAYRIARMPSPILFVRPKQEDAEGWVKERFVPMVRATPALSHLVRLGRSSDSTLRYKRFPGGFLFVPSAASATELASRSSPFVVLDEVDRMEALPGEGNPVEIVMRRTGATDVSTVGMTSTPRHADTTLIWPYLEAGTNERYHVPCPHCDTMQELVWGGPNEARGLKWPSGKPEAAEYLCGHCGAMIAPNAKRDMIEAGDWVPTNPEGQYPSSHLNGLYSPFAGSSWGVLAREFVRATGKPLDLQVFVNTRLAELWTDDQEVVAADKLRARLEPFSEGIVPAGYGCLTAGVDVQGNRLEAYIWAWGDGLESVLVASFVLLGDPGKDSTAPDSVWRELDEVLLKKYPHANGGELPIVATFVDSGHQTSTVYRYTKPRLKYRIFACKGTAGGNSQLLSKAKVQGADRVPLYTVNTDKAKDEFLRSQILERQQGPGYVHLPDWMTSDQLDQLASEVRKPRVQKRVVIWEWVRKRDDLPNEALDCRVYARAALDAMGQPFIRRLKAMAEKFVDTSVARETPDITDPVIPEPEVPFIPPPSAPSARRPGVPFKTPWSKRY
jgi:phage terminase large subunit GpA-like protein